MQQMILVILVGYVCVRCLACNIQGEIRECVMDSGASCYDLDLRLQFEKRQPRDRPEPNPWIEERWQLSRSREPREPPPHLARKRPRQLQLAMEPSARFQRVER